jgi:hypothetical protein
MYGEVEGKLHWIDVDVYLHALATLPLGKGRGPSWEWGRVGPIAAVAVGDYTLYLQGIKPGLSI